MEGFQGPDRAVHDPGDLRVFQPLIVPLGPLVVSLRTELASILKGKFWWDDEDVREALMIVGRHADLVKPGMRLRVLQDDADNRVLECAVEGRAEWILSGDHHLLGLKEFRGIQIVRVAEFLSKLGEHDT